MLTLIGTVLTALGTGVTLFEAWRVRTYREQIALDLRKIRLSEVADHLRSAQDGARQLVTPIEELKRGRGEREAIHRVQSAIDNALNLLNISGDDSDVRDKIVDAQNSLRSFQNADPGDEKDQAISKHHSEIQEAISLCRERINKLGTNQPQ